MKTTRFLASALAIGAMLIIFNSCNSGDDKKATDAPIITDSSNALKTEPATNSGYLMLIKHSVADFSKWLLAYESHDSMRLAYGLHSYGVSRGVDDTNMVMVALKIDDMKKAKEFEALPDLKARMQIDGAVGPTSITYYNRAILFLGTNDPSLRVMVTHKVKDWTSWKKVYEDHKQARIAAGLTDRSVGYEVDNDKMVTLVDVVSDLPKARAFFASKELKDKMQAAGVEGAPTIFLYNLVKKF